MKYLFVCEYDDKVYYQTPKDISKKDKTKSAFYDVIDKPIKRFSLNGEHKYLVDLTDGHFEVDGIQFKMHEEDLSDFRIIYYRKHTRQFNGTNEVGHEIEYCIGWQTNKDGKNYKQILIIK